MKQCNTCKQWKDESEFHRDRSKKDGYATSCIMCKRHGKPRYTDLIKPTGILKQCSRCKQWKDTSGFNKNNKKEDGYTARCKACIKEAQSEYVKSTARDSRGYKYCKYCKTWKPESEFYKKSCAPDGLNNKCKVCCSIEEKQNINKRREYNKQRQNKMREYQRKYREQNKNKLLKYYRDKWANNPTYRVSNNVSGLIRHVLTNSTKAERHWETLVPYTLCNI